MSIGSNQQPPWGVEEKLGTFRKKLAIVEDAVGDGRWHPGREG